MRNRIEEQHCVAFASWAAMQSCIVPDLKKLIHIPNGGVRPYKTNPKTGARYSVEGQKLKRMGLKPGPWDYFLPCPRYFEGELRPGLWLELKAPKGRMSDAQLDWKTDMLAEGYVMAECHSWIEARNMTMRYLGVILPGIGEVMH